MICSKCNGQVIWIGPLSNLTHTECVSCGGKNCQRPDDEYDNFSDFDEDEDEKKHLWDMVHVQETDDQKAAFMVNWLRGEIKIPRDVQLRIHENISKETPDLAQSLADALEALIGAIEKYETPETETHYGQSIESDYVIDEPLKQARSALANYRKGE